MKNNYSIESYIAKYMDENRYNIKEACLVLEIDTQNLFQRLNNKLK